jgi:type IV secretion system protein VirD4
MIKLNFFPFIFAGKIIRWCMERKILTIPRIIILLFMPVLAFLDFLGIVPVYMLPKTIWPPLTPEMTWSELFKYLNTPTPDGKVIWWHKTIELFTERPPGFWLAQLPFALLCAVLLVLFWRTGWPNKRDVYASKRNTYGSSRWRKTGELKNTLYKTSFRKPQKAGIVVGSQGNTAWLTDPGKLNPHTLIIGATGSGKSRRVIMPSVWTIGNVGESMIISDPKGEIYEHTSGWLKEKGYNVVLLDLLEPTRGSRWNPLSRIASNYMAENIEEASREAWEIGNILAWAYGAGQDPIWPQAEESLIAALCLATVIEAPEGAKNMTSAYRMLTQMGMRGGESLDGWLENMPHSHPARMAYGTAALSESRTRSSIYTGTAAHLRLFADPSIAWLTSKSDFDPTEAGRKKTAIFLLMPDEAGARRHIASLFVNQVYAALSNTARKNGGKLPVPVWFLLDEFGNIGKIPNIAEKFTVARSRNIRFVLAVQAKAQLEHVYDRKTAEIIMGNCDTWLYLRTADVDTAREISQKTGRYTVHTKSVQKKKYASETVGETSRELLTPDEVLRWKTGYTLLLQAGQFPAKLPIRDMSELPGIKEAFLPGPVEEREIPQEEMQVKTWVPMVYVQNEVSETSGGSGDSEEPAKSFF